MKSRPLNQDSASPLYKQLIKKLREDIAAGLYPIHSRIPSEQQLCDAYHVSRVTVRKALQELTQEGLLLRHQGKGTFVSIPRIQKDLKVVNSFHTACRRLGCTPDSRLIHKHLQAPSPLDCESLHLKENQQVIEIARLRLADGLPVMLEVNRFPDTYAFLLSEEFQSLYACLEAHHLEPHQAVHDISLTYASPQQARLLQINQGDALLCLEEVIYDQNGQPLHTSHQVIRGDRFTFRI
ncbi:MAG: GntR family transcriptional regulator [Clostridia bacterium]|nr:GntR family transcriptional regulator [Clostridia bacterium]